MTAHTDDSAYPLVRDVTRDMSLLTSDSWLSRLPGWCPQTRSMAERYAMRGPVWEWYDVLLCPQQKPGEWNTETVKASNRACMVRVDFDLSGGMKAEAEAIAEAAGIARTFILFGGGDIAPAQGKSGCYGRGMLGLTHFGREITHRLPRMGDPGRDDDLNDAAKEVAAVGNFAGLALLPSDDPFERTTFISHFGFMDVYRSPLLDLAVLIDRSKIAVHTMTPWKRVGTGDRRAAIIGEFALEARSGCAMFIRPEQPAKP